MGVVGRGRTCESFNYLRVNLFSVWKTANNDTRLREKMFFVSFILISFITLFPVQYDTRQITLFQFYFESQSQKSVVAI